MDNGSNTKQLLSGEASCSRPKRQRLVAMENALGAANGDVMARFGVLSDLDLLHCLNCSKALTSPIYQCVDGHMTCSSCYNDLRNQCPSCGSAVGNYRSRIMERILESVIVPCRNAEHGCKEKFSYGKELVHEKECCVYLCYCPEPGCNYKGMYKNLYSHYYAKHEANCLSFTCGQYDAAWVRISKKILVLQEYENGPLVVVQCFKAAHGVYVTVNCISPSVPGVGEYSYRLIYRRGRERVSYESKKMNRIKKISFETPLENYMFMPYWSLGESPILKMVICIRKLGEER